MSSTTSKNSTPGSAAALLAQALALHRQGRAQEALACYGSILKVEPKNTPARYYQGLLRLQSGAVAAGIADLKLVVERQPDHAEAHYNLGLAYSELRNDEQALSHFKRASALQPNMVEAVFYTGMLLAKSGKPQEALPYLERARQLNPGLAEVQHNLGGVLAELGRHEEAAAAFAKAIEFRPDLAEAYVGLGNALRKLERFEEACTQYRQAIRLKPDFVEAYGSLGEVLRELGQHVAARDCFAKLLEMRPQDVDAMLSLGAQFCTLGQLDEALVYFKRALQMRPDDAACHQSIGVIHAERGDYAQAMAAYDRALQLDPDRPQTHITRSMILLGQGKFEEGWRDYEYGLSVSEGGRRAYLRNYPRWQGEALGGKTLLVCAEQGIGDEIMFASILPEIIQEAGHCVVECDVKLMRLYQRSFPSARIVRRKKRGEADTLPSGLQIDVQSPVGSLALYRRNRLEDFSRHTGYLKADPERVAYWKHRLDELGPGLKVGISWRGGTVATGLNRRSIPLAEWLPVLRQAGAQFVSLQYTECREEIAALEAAHGIRVAHWQEAIDDYDETAALVSALNLVQTVQTAVFHLSGALGRPVWGLIAKPSEWRYLQEGESLPWYPSARMFRQAQPGDWAEVIGKVAGELGRFAGAASGSADVKKNG